MDRDGSGDRIELRVLAEGQIRESAFADGVEITGYQGPYAYERTGRDAARVTLLGEQSEWYLHFASPDSGWRARAAVEAGSGEAWSGGGWHASAPGESTPDPGGGAGDGDDHGDDRASATPVAAGSATPGRLHSGDADWFRIDLDGPGRLEVYTSGDVDTTGRLEDAAGGLVGSGDDFGADINFRIEATVAAGAYYVAVRGFGPGDTGAYTLHAHLTVTPPSFTGAQLPGNRAYTVGAPITALTLPQATGGSGRLLYSLAPNVPGLTFDAAARRLSGTPTRAGDYSMTYTVRDNDGDTDSLNFTIAVTAADTAPSFSGSQANLSYTENSPISARTLPAATGGDGNLTYSLSPSVPGLTFTAATRRLSGTPTRAGTYRMTYTVRDSDGDTDSLNFTIAVASAPTGGGGGGGARDGDCYVGLLVNPGGSCAYPGTSNRFSVTADGRGRFLFFTAGNALNINSGNISFAASHQGGGVWRIDRVGGG